jgi:Meckel syndrome type 1 protein
VKVVLAGAAPAPEAVERKAVERNAEAAQSNDDAAVPAEAKAPVADAPPHGTLVLPDAAPAPPVESIGVPAGTMVLPDGGKGWIAPAPAVAVSVADAKLGPSTGPWSETGGASRARAPRRSTWLAVGAAGVVALVGAVIALRPHAEGPALPPGTTDPASAAPPWQLPPPVEAPPSQVAPAAERPSSQAAPPAETPTAPASVERLAPLSPAVAPAAPGPTAAAPPIAAPPSPKPPAAKARPGAPAASSARSNAPPPAVDSVLLQRN